MWQQTTTQDIPSAPIRQKRRAAEMDHEITAAGSPETFTKYVRVPVIVKAPRFQHPSASPSIPGYWPPGANPHCTIGNSGYSFAKPNNISHKDWQQAGPSGLRAQASTDRVSQGHRLSDRGANMEEEAADVLANMGFYINRGGGTERMFANN
ncbi:unnamed protein product [Ixodes hexagonus]